MRRRAKVSELSANIKGAAATKAAKSQKPQTSCTARPLVDKAGKVMREVKVATKPEAILAVLTEEGLAIERIGLEAGPATTNGNWSHAFEFGPS